MRIRFKNQTVQLIKLWQALVWTHFQSCICARRGGINCLNPVDRIHITGGRFLWHYRYFRWTENRDLNNTNKAQLEVILFEIDCATSSLVLLDARYEGPVGQAPRLAHTFELCRSGRWAHNVHNPPNRAEWFPTPASDGKRSRYHQWHEPSQDFQATTRRNKRFQVGIFAYWSVLFLWKR